MRRDPISGVEEPLGETITEFLFAEASLRDGTWALITGDGSDTFCGWSQRPWEPSADALQGNSIQLLRPADGLAWTLDAPPMASGYGVSVGLAPGGLCASVPEGADWSAGLESFDLQTGQRQPFPDGFTFGGWLD